MKAEGALAGGPPAIKRVQQDGFKGIGLRVLEGAHDVAPFDSGGKASGF